MFIGNGFLNQCGNWGFARISLVPQKHRHYKFAKIARNYLEWENFRVRWKKKSWKKGNRTEATEYKCWTNLMLFIHALCVPDWQQFNAYAKYRAKRMENKHTPHGFSVHLVPSPFSFSPLPRSCLSFSLSLFDPLSFITSAPSLFTDFSVVFALYTVQTH